jgi:hypothetical protein
VQLSWTGDAELSIGTFGPRSTSGSLHQSFQINAGSTRFVQIFHRGGGKTDFTLVTTHPN